MHKYMLLFLLCIASLRGAGEMMWEQVGNVSAGINYLHGVAQDTVGNYLVTGMYGGVAIIASVDPITHEVRWKKVIATDNPNVL